MLDAFNLAVALPMTSC